MNKNLGKIKEVDLRDIFEHEARDLTPWLAEEENLNALSDAIGTDLKLLAVEASVGRFNVDILAEEEGSGKKVIIENQLEPTDHDHLGKLITYASGLEAGVIIWLFREIHDEHRKAMEWLNTHMDDTVHFFAIRLKLLQIDDSKPAPWFEIIEQPNEWANTVKSATSGEISETKLQQLNFWTEFKNWVTAKDRNLQLQTPRPQQWYNVRMGSSDAHIHLGIIQKDNRLDCGLYIQDNKALFHFLEKRKDEIEAKLGEKAEWVIASKATRIKIGKTGAGYAHCAVEDFEWFYAKILKVKNVFGPLLKEFKAQNGSLDH